jgi:histidine triad (HIT) family protein
MTDCIFCKIIAGQSPAKMLYQDDLVSAFRDTHPAASIHVLIVSNKHLTSVNEVEASDEAMLGRLFTVARKLSEQEGINRSGYRLIVNNGKDAGQVIYHLHMHLLGGQHMRHPIG